VTGGVLDYLTLGDSPIVVRGSAEGITVIEDDRVANLPGGRPYTRELVRSLRNQHGGFWVASTNPDAARQAVAGSVPYSASMIVGLFTDGASRLVEFFGYSWQQIFVILEADGPAAVIAAVRSAETRQPLSGYNKPHDDATAVLISTGRAGPGPRLAPAGSA
jgi:hypothetical protein